MKIGLKAVIRAKIIYPSGMAPSEWTCSIRAGRDTAVADYSALGVNNRCRVVYCPLIGVSQFLLPLLVSNFKPIMWHCSQLWLYIGMAS